MVDLAKVKRNVKRMVDQGAPESEIDEYISTEGTTIDAVRAAPLTSAKGVGSAVGDFFKHTATNALDTLSLGWNDEAAAGLAALPALMPGGESYSQAYDRLHKGQQRLVDEADQDMAAKVAGQTIGLAPAMLATAGMPAMASAARAAPQLTGAPGMAKTALDAVRPAATTGGRIVQGATYGGAAGGLSQGGHDTGDGDWYDPYLATATGALAGGVVTGAGEAIGAIPGMVRSMAARGTPAQTKRQAASRITDWAQKEDVSPLSLVHRVREAKSSGADESAILDAGSSNLPVMARAIANRGGTASDILKDFANGRKANQYSRYMREIERQLGPIEDTAVLKQQLKEKADMITEPLYRAGHGDQIPVDETLRAALERPSVKSAAKQANRNFLEEGAMPPQIYDEAGKVREDLKTLPAQMLHYLREGLDISIDLLEQQPKANRQRGSIIQTRKLLDERIKGGSERMAMADARHAELMRGTEALKYGSKVNLKQPQDVSRFAANASPEELDLFRSGARENYANSIGTMRDGQNIPKNFMASPRQRQVMSTVAPSQEKGDSFSRFLASERSQMRSDDKLLGNSTTTEQLLAAQELDKAPMTERASEAIKSKLGTVVRNKLADMVSSSGRISDAERQVIAEMLTNTSEEGLQEFLDYAMQRAVQQIARQHAIGPVSTLGGYMAGQWAGD